MKDSARMNDYMEYLQQQVDMAREQGESILVLTAKDVHNAVSINPTLPTCCSAMKRLMKDGDEIITEPATKTGFGNSLTIKYLLNDRDSREEKFPPSKRGRRPSADKQEEKKTIKAERGEKVELESCLVKWLDEMNVMYQIEENRIIVDGTYGKWLIVMDLPKKGPKQNFYGKVYEMLTELDEKYEKCSLAITGNLNYENQWKKMPEIVKKRLNISLLKTTPKNKVIEL